MTTHKTACHFFFFFFFFFEVNENIEQSLLILKELFNKDSEVEDLFCGVSPALNPFCSSVKSLQLE